MTSLFRYSLLLCLFSFSINTNAQQVPTDQPEPARVDKPVSTGSSIVPDAKDTSFMPPQSELEKHDWVQLTSGEWLQGDILSLYEDELEFDSDKLDIQTFDWEDVSILLSRAPLSVLMDDRSVFTGKVLVERGMIHIDGAESILRDRKMIVSIAPTGKNPLDLWDGEISLSADITNGNTQQSDFTARFNAQRRTATSRFLFSYLGQYSQVSDINVENNQRATSTLDRFITKDWYYRPLYLEYYTDEFQNIDYRLTYTAAIGYYIINTTKTEWDTYAGPGYQKTRYNTVLATEDEVENTYVGIIGTRFSMEVTGDIDIDAQYQAQFVNEASGDLTQHAEVGTSIDLIYNFDLDVRFIWDNVDKPKADENGVVPKRTDTQLIIGIKYEF